MLSSYIQRIILSSKHFIFIAFIDIKQIRIFLFFFFYYLIPRCHICTCFISDSILILSFSLFFFTYYKIRIMLLCTYNKLNRGNVFHMLSDLLLCIVLPVFVFFLFSHSFNITRNICHCSYHWLP